MSQETPVQPKLGDLMARFLARQAEAHADGIAAFDEGAEVVPYEAGPVQPIDARQAWDEAQVVADFYSARKDRKALTVPPGWGQLVAAHEPVVALPFCLGNFPQMVRNFHLLLHSTDLGAMKPAAGRSAPAPSLVEWAEKAAGQKAFPSVILALGALRLAKCFAEATKMAATLEASVPAEWQPAWRNEKAALLWQQGRAEEARDQWNRMEESIPVLFNRGMAELFLGNHAKARASLSRAVASLPEGSAWHHLGRLYLTLSEAR